MDNELIQPGCMVIIHFSFSVLNNLLFLAKVF